MRSPARATGGPRERRPEPIGPGEVHAWVAGPGGAGAAPGRLLDRAELDRAELDRAELDAAELDRAARYRRPRDGARFAASRGWLRQVLGRYLDADPAGLRFTVDSAGRPALAGEHADRLQFSLSRSGERVLIAVSLTPVGADIEIVRSRPGLADIIASRFSVAEAECIRGGCGGSPTRGFYRHWTAKEAYLKATGCGLAGLRRTELACDGPDTIRVGGRPAEGWTLSLPDVASDCATAIVGSGSVTRCHFVGQ